MKHFSEEHKQKMKESKLCDKNPMWKGNDVRRVALHNWIRRRKSKPVLCEQCQEKPPVDLANISGEYKRDVSDFQWICRRCHMINDGRLSKLEQHNLEKLGQHLSEETKQKLRERLSGENHPMFGKHLSKKTKQKISEALSGEKNHNFGTHCSTENKQKLRELYTGTHRSEETKRKIREHLNKPEIKQKIRDAKLGERNPMFGKHHSEEHKQRLREAMLGNKNPFFGRHHSEETIQKIKEAKLRNMNGGSMYAKSIV